MDATAQEKGGRGQLRASLPVQSRLVQSERYLLTVMRCIELNPIRAAMVEAPQDYR